MVEILACRDLRQTFVQGDETVHVLDGVDFSLQAGEMVALTGPSGAGKSTLLHALGLLEKASGEIALRGERVDGLNDKQRTLLRLKTMGFVYQMHHLLPEFSAVENVMIPLRLQGIARSIAKQQAVALLEKVGLGHRLHHRPARLSGGEQQRVAIARALVAKPALLLADEPTGNLDGETGMEVFAMLQQLVKEQQMAALIATHNPDLANRMDKIWHLQKGKLTARIP
ncbi:MAG: ABC transporter ATP-binding protein [Alphaproteobacteria bacterium]